MYGILWTFILMPIVIAMGVRMVAGGYQIAGGIQIAMGLASFGLHIAYGWY
jgi:hypothetical protein